MYVYNMILSIFRIILLYIQCNVLRQMLFSTTIVSIFYLIRLLSPEKETRMFYEKKEDKRKLCANSDYY